MIYDNNCQVCHKKIKFGQDDWVESFNGAYMGISHLKCARSTNR